MTQPAPQVAPIAVESRQYKSRSAYQKDVLRMQQAGWVVQSTQTTESRRLLGCLFGLIGYWVLPKRTVFHVTYAKFPPAA